MKWIRFKKTALALVILGGFISVIPLVLTSCSNTTTPNVNDEAKSTNFLEIGTVKNDSKLNKILPSEAINELSYIVIFIFNNLITGKKQDITTANIAIDQASIYPVDTSGTLWLSYEINAYWVNDVFINTPKVFNLEINGFTIKQN